MFTRVPRVCELSRIVYNSYGYGLWSSHCCGVLALPVSCEPACYDLGTVCASPIAVPQTQGHTACSKLLLGAPSNQERALGSYPRQARGSCYEQAASAAHLSRRVAVGFLGNLASPRCWVTDVGAQFRMFASETHTTAPTDGIKVGATTEEIEPSDDELPDKPEGSRIILQQTESGVTIIIPPQGLTSEYKKNVTWGTVLMFGGTAMTALTLYQGRYVSSVLSLIAACLGYFRVTMNLTLAFFQDELVLDLDQDIFTLNRSVLLPNVPPRSLLQVGGRLSDLGWASVVQAAAIAGVKAPPGTQPDNDTSTAVLLDDGQAGPMVGTFLSVVEKEWLATWINALINTAKQNRQNKQQPEQEGQQQEEQQLPPAQEPSGSPQAAQSPSPDSSSNHSKQ